MQTRREIADQNSTISQSNLIDIYRIITQQQQNTHPLQGHMKHLQEQTHSEL
jgi:hypothetical protein